MSDQFVGEIRMFAGTFAPYGWALCQGQIIPIAQNPTLFSLLGTTYGGNGTTNFALPDLRGMAPMQPGQGPGLTPHVLGDQGGTAAVTLSQGQNAMHNHLLGGQSGPAANASPAGGVYAVARAVESGKPPTAVWPYSTQTPDATLNPAALAPFGSQQPQPHNNLMPYLAVTFIIALTGLFPPRS